VQRYFVFLRAINVGGRTIKMDQLRELFRSFGYDEVETFIASGNVILESGEQDSSVVEAHIEASLQEALGYAVPAMIRTTDELRAIRDYRPFSEEAFGDMGDTYYVWLLKSAPAHGIREILAGYETPDDLFRVQDREIYWLCRMKISQTEVPTTKLERAFGTPCTMRNMNTVRRLLAKYG
jgi:uncharacterized protein (DUF1697 family)